MTNKEKFITAYCDAFAEHYNNDDNRAILTERLIRVIEKTSIYHFKLHSPVLQKACEKVGIDCTYKAIEQYLAQ